MLLFFVIGISTLLVSIDKKEKRKRMNKLLNGLSESGTRHSLTFSSQEILRDCIIGLDGVHGKLCVLNYNDKEENKTVLIDLSEVKHCSVKKYYGTISGGELPAKKLETYLELIVLHFEFSNAKDPVEIPFYNHTGNHISEILGLEQKAKHWETMLSKLIHVPSKKIA